MEARFCILREGSFWVPKWEAHTNRGNSPMPTITKAATPLRMPRYWTPKTTWYRKRATRQLRPMLAIPKKDRNTGQGKRQRGQRSRTQQITNPFRVPDSGWVLPYTHPQSGAPFTTPSTPSTVVHAEKGPGRRPEWQMKPSMEEVGLLMGPHLCRTHL